MSSIKARLVGVELYFDDLVAAKNFYEGTLGLDIFGEHLDTMPSLTLGKPFCAWRKGRRGLPVAG
jgi:hypothetical protein